MKMMNKDEDKGEKQKKRLRKEEKLGVGGSQGCIKNRFGLVVCDPNPILTLDRANFQT